MKVMVAGAWDEKRPEILSYAEELGRGIAEHNWTLITGGGSGIAAAAEHGARLASGTTIAIIGATGKTDSEKTSTKNTPCKSILIKDGTGDH